MGRYFRAQAIRVFSCPSAIDFNEPCIIKKSIGHWPAISERKWHPRRLQAMYGERLFEWGVGPNGNETLLTSLSHFFRRKHPRSRHRCYVFDSTFEVDCPELLQDYSVPALFQFGSPDTPTCQPVPHNQHSNRWLLLGHAGSGSRLHADPPTTSAWNALVFGRKEWVVVQPDALQHEPQQAQDAPRALAQSSGAAYHQRMLEDASSAPLYRWFSKHVPRLWHHARCNALSGIDVASGGGSPPRMMRFTQRPGDVVHIPSGWLHAVLNRSLSVAVTHNFISPASARCGRRGTGCSEQAEEVLPSIG